MTWQIFVCKFCMYTRPSCVVCMSHMKWVRQIGTKAPSCVVCMPHMKWFGQIRREPQSAHDKNLWPLTWKWCATHYDIMGCVSISYEENRWNRDGATWATSNDPCDLDLGPFILKVYATYVQPHRDGATERTRHKCLVTGVTPISNDLHRWSFDLEMYSDPMSRHGLYLHQVQSRSVR